MQYSEGGLEKWIIGLGANMDDYGFSCYRYARRLAEELERRMADGKRLSEALSEAETVADAGIGITGYMYGAVIHILFWSWVYGDALRQVHNAHYLKGDALRKANEGTGVVNPAILHIAV